MRQLEFFRGSWTGTGTFHDSPFGARKAIRMTITTTSVEEGFWYQLRTQEQPSPENPDPLTARYLWGFDPGTDTYVAHWFDSRGSHAEQTSRGWDNDVLLFEGHITNGGVTVPLRDTFTRLGADRYLHVGEVDLGAGWIIVDDEDVHRDRPTTPARVYTGRFADSTETSR